MKKRLISIVIAFFMCLSLIPTTVFAADEPTTYQVDITCSNWFTEMDPSKMTYNLETPGFELTKQPYFITFTSLGKNIQLTGNRDQTQDYWLAIGLQPTTASFDEADELIVKMNGYENTFTTFEGGHVIEGETSPIVAYINVKSYKKIEQVVIFPEYLEIGKKLSEVQSIVDAKDNESSNLFGIDYELKVYKGDSVTASVMGAEDTFNPGQKYLFEYSIHPKNINTEIIEKRIDIIHGKIFSDSYMRGISEVGQKGHALNIYCLYEPQEKAQSSTVTFKVENGTWDGTDTADKSAEVILTNGKGTLQESQIPVGMKPAKGYEGGAWDVEPNTSKDGITGDVTYTYSFTKKADLISITEVELTGFTAPVYGAKPDFEMSVPKGAHYHFASTQELKDEKYEEDFVNLAINGIWWNNLSECMSEDDIFTDTSENAYYMDLALIPDDGYEFAEVVNATINGNASLLKSCDSSRTNLYIMTKTFTVTEPTPESITYTLSFDKNGATGTIPAPMTQTTTEESYEFTVPGQGNLVKENHLFAGWLNEETNYVYEPGDKIELDKENASVTLSAYWYELPEVKFDISEAKAESVPVDFHASYNNDKMSVEIPTTPVPSRDGYEFQGYTMSVTKGMPMLLSPANSITCQPGDVIELGKDIALGTEYTLTAEWQKVETPEEITVTLTYDANGGTDAPKAQSVIVTNPEGTALFIVTDQIPTREGYEFVCWSFDEDDSEFAINAGDQINLGQNMTLYAHWKEIDNPSPETPDIEDPDNPNKPDIENPDKPNKPDIENPDKPNKPDTEKPVKPEVKPEVPTKPATKPNVPDEVPHTGDNSNGMLWALFSIVSLGSVVALTQNKKKNRSTK